MQTGKLVKVFVYLKGKRIEIEPDEARALLAQLKATLGDAPAPQYARKPYTLTTTQTPDWMRGGVTSIDWRAQ